MTQPKSLINFLIFDEAVFTALFCAAFSFLVILPVYATLGDVPVWGSASISSGLVVLGFVLGFASYWVVKRHVQQKFGQSWGFLRDTPRLMRIGMWLVKRSPMAKAAMAGVIGLLFVVLPLLMVLELAGIHELTLWQFVSFSSAAGALQGLVIAPLVAYLVISENIVSSNVRSLQRS